MLSIVDKVDWSKASSVVTDAWAKAAPQMMEEFKEHVVDMCSQQCDFVHHSKAGNYPLKETGSFTKGLNVGSVQADPLVVGLGSRATYGRYLQVGIGMEPRPWMDLALNDEDWFERLAELARASFGE